VVGQPGEGLRGEAKGGGVEGLQVRGGFPMQVHVSNHNCKSDQVTLDDPSQGLTVEMMLAARRMVIPI
jgi:hypothetical protein